MNQRKGMTLTLCYLFRTSKDLTFVIRKTRRFSAERIKSDNTTQRIRARFFPSVTSEDVLLPITRNYP
jgi:hypothetical protein